jgi:hypothetical protein
LFTLDQQRLYTCLGWQHVQPSSWHGHAVDIMMKRRAQTPNQALEPTAGRRDAHILIL